MSPALFWQSVFGAGLLAACAVVWGVILRRRTAGSEVLAYERRRPVPWGGAELLLLVIVFLGIQLGVYAAAGAVARMRDSSADGATSISSPEGTASAVAVSVVALGLGLAIVRLASRASWEDVGLTLASLRRDAFVGAAAFAATAAPVYATQAVLTQFMKSEHPLVRLWEHDTSTSTVVLIFLAAVVVAPLFEEFVFRGLLQGWLEKLAATYQETGPYSPAYDGSWARSPDDLLEPKPAGLEAGSVPPAGETDEANPDASPNSGPSVAQTVSEDAPQPRLRGWFAAAPILASATLFAAAHYSHGPDPIALFLLALVLGFLYQRTHRLWPSVVLHACLNATSLALLAAGMA